VEYGKSFHKKAAQAAILGGGNTAKSHLSKNTFQELF
jgi:hypothetical protein